MTDEEKKARRKISNHRYYCKHKNEILCKQKLKRIEKRKTAEKAEKQKLAFNAKDYGDSYRKAHRKEAIIATNKWREENIEYERLRRQLYSRKRNAGASHNAIREQAFEEALNLVSDYWKAYRDRQRAEKLRNHT